MNDFFSLDGKTALVTGAGRGLGREIALGLARFGASLILADAVLPEETEKLIRDQGTPCLSIRTDISDEPQVMNLADQAKKEFRTVDILINNAGVIQQGFTATEDLSCEEWDRVIRINLTGTFLCCKHIGKIMIAAKGGSIVNVASTAGITGIPRAPAYCASKSGVILLTKSLALEWAGYNIRVNAVAPHYLETDLTKNVRGAAPVYAAVVKQIPMARLGKPSEVFGAVLYLASPASGFTTGTVIPVDGGYLAR